MAGEPKKTDKATEPKAPVEKAPEKPKSKPTKARKGTSVTSGIPKPDAS